MTLLPFLVAVFVTVLSAVGLVAPGPFVQLVTLFQQSPTIYLSALIRFVVGVILLRGASTSRTPRFVRILGAAIAMGGLVTPFIGVWLGRTILSWWQAGGDPIVRVWAGTGVLLGLGLSIALRPQASRMSA